MELCWSKKWQTQPWLCLKRRRRRRCLSWGAQGRIRHVLGLCIVHFGSFPTGTVYLLPLVPAYCDKHCAYLHAPPVCLLDCAVTHSSFCFKQVPLLPSCWLVPQKLNNNTYMVHLLPKAYNKQSRLFPMFDTQEFKAVDVDKMFVRFHRSDVLRCSC